MRRKFAQSGHPVKSAKKILLFLTAANGRNCFKQGCQIFLDTTYQNVEKCTQKTVKYTKDCKIYQMTLKYTK
jgi:hypothetical protein